MKTWKIIATVVVVGGIAAAIVGYTMYNKPHRNFEKLDAEFQLTADELYSAFAADEAAALEKFVGKEGKPIEITGTIEEISTANDQTQLMLAAEDAMMAGINAQLAAEYATDEEYIKAASDLQTGTAIDLKCRCVGYDDMFGEVKLDNCYILKN
jgi:hypothetical protein